MLCWLDRDVAVHVKQSSLYSASRLMHKVKYITTGTFVVILINCSII